VHVKLEGKQKKQTTVPVQSTKLKTLLAESQGTLGLEPSALAG
jgi:hypothetical protein